MNVQRPRDVRVPSRHVDVEPEHHPATRVQARAQVFEQELPRRCVPRRTVSVHIESGLERGAHVEATAEIGQRFKCRDPASDAAGRPQTETSSPIARLDRAMSSKPRYVPDGAGQLQGSTWSAALQIEDPVRDGGAASPEGIEAVTPARRTTPDAMRPLAVDARLHARVECVRASR